MAISTLTFLYTLLLSAMIVFNIAGNSLVCLLILKNKAMKTSINWLLFHLAVADLLVAVFFIPPCVLSHFIEQPGGVIGDVLCKFITGGTLGWAAASASSFLLVAVAFERYYATLYPFRSLSRTRSRWLVPFLSFLGILLIVPSLAVAIYDSESQSCASNWPNYTAIRAYNLSWSFCNSMLPICIMGYLYARIILHLRTYTAMPGSSQSPVTRSKTKITKMLISVTAIYVTCWTPQIVLCATSPVLPGGYTTVYLVSTASALLNSCLNPLVYTLHSQQFRENLASLMRYRKTKYSTAQTTKESNPYEIKLSLSPLNADTLNQSPPYV